MAQYELNLRDYFRIFSKRKWLILSTIVMVTIATLVYIYHQPTIYEAFTTVKIVERKTQAGLMTDWM
ncbi:Wzz/FepE/Etk N-terminal domain-containing protein, partial [Candidatus Margulisiibacteriota bacterium]